MTTRLSRSGSDARPVTRPQGASPATSPRTDPSPATIPRSDPSPATSLRTDASPPRAAEAASTVIAALLPQRPSTVVIDDGAVVIHLHYGGHPPDTQSRAPSPAEQLPAPAPRRANPPRSSMYGPLDGAVAVAAATQVAQAMDASLDAAAVVAGAADPPSPPPSPPLSSSSSEGPWPAALPRR